MASGDTRLRLEIVPVQERFFAVVDSVEVRLVARTAAACERAGARRVAAAATALGNGWLYPILSLGLMLAVDRPIAFLLSAIASFGLAFAVYPSLKTALRRTRPCDYDPSLVHGTPPLDTYSCPSGHAMTAAAYSVPMVFAAPETLPLALTLVATIGWSRIALGHHYVSDVVLGAILGVTVAVPIASMFL